MVDSTEKVSTGCEVLGCSDTLEKGSTTSLHIRSGRDDVSDWTRAARASIPWPGATSTDCTRLSMPYYAMALTTFPKRTTKAKYMCPSGNILYSMADNGVKCLNCPWPVKWLKGKQDSG